MRRFHLVLLCLVSVMGESDEGGIFARWKAWYNLKLKPCLRSCPYQSEFVCGFDHGRQRYAVASSRCALAKRNACFDEDYKEIPIEDCLKQLKFYSEESKVWVLTQANLTNI